MEIGQIVMREQVKRRQPGHICEPFERSFHVTSWTAAWKGLDFSSALLTEAEVIEKEQQEKEKAEEKDMEGGKKEKIEKEKKEKRQHRMTSEVLVLGLSHPRDAPARCEWTSFFLALPRVSPFPPPQPLPLGAQRLKCGSVYSSLDHHVQDFGGVLGRSQCACQGDEFTERVLEKGSDAGENLRISLGT